jgi:hypothetical protein
MRQYLRTGAGVAIAAAAVLSALGAIPAQAQVPGGSYLETCSNVRAFGDRIIADCRRADGAWSRTALRDPRRCVGDIANTNGQLACARDERQFGWGRNPDYRQWEDGSGTSSNSPPPQNYGPRYFGGYNSLYGFGR